MEMNETAWKEYCPFCTNFETAMGVCSVLHRNISSNPQLFSKKCNSKFFKNDPSKSRPEPKIEEPPIQEIQNQQVVTSTTNIAEAVAETPEDRQALAKKYSRKMVSGILWAVGGTIVTAATYSAASHGGRYFIAWGAILFGIIDFFQGLAGWMKYKDS